MEIITRNFFLFLWGGGGGLLALSSPFGNNMYHVFWKTNNYHQIMSDYSYGSVLYFPVTQKITCTGPYDIGKQYTQG